MYDVTIHAVLNGWTVQVGCQTMVYTKLVNLLEDLDAYLTNPKSKEEFCRQNCINKFLLTELPVTCPPPSRDSLEARIETCPPPSSRR